MISYHILPRLQHICTITADTVAVGTSVPLRSALYIIVTFCAHLQNLHIISRFKNKFHVVGFIYLLVFNRNWIQSVMYTAHTHTHSTHTNTCTCACMQTHTHTHILHLIFFFF